MYRVVIAVSLVLLLSSVAHAERCPIDEPVRVSISCTAEMNPTSTPYSISDQTEPQELKLKLTEGPGNKGASLTFGGHRLGGGLLCDGKNWIFSVSLVRIGQPKRPGEILFAVGVTANDVAHRKGGPALEVSSSHLFEPSINYSPNLKIGLLRFTCALRVH
jgi:hypothetical protein